MAKPFHLVRDAGVGPPSVPHGIRTMIDLAVNTQTPPVRPLRPRPPRTNRTWVLGRDYTLNRGGVVPMMRSLLHQGRSAHWLGSRPLWVTLGEEGLPPFLVTDEGYRLETVALPPASRAGYQRFKESIWRSFHGPAEFVPPWKDYGAFVDYSHRAAQALLKHADAYDLFYVNDFQQMLVGGLIGSAAPALLHWHIPVDFRGYPEPVRRFFLKAMEGFDAIVVSTRGALEHLIGAGFQGRAFQVYPFIDPEAYRLPTPQEVSRFRSRWGIPADAPVVLSVSRMDPVKRQDMLLYAARSLLRKFPDLRVVLVGGGSFSTRGPGEAYSKGAVWRRHLDRLTRHLGLRSNIVFTGEVSQAELGMAYTMADVFAHAAPWEGFGLVAAEAWHYGRPVVVSSGSGVSELVTDGVNGFRAEPERVNRFTQAIGRLLANRAAAERMGQEGRQRVRACYISEAGPRMREIFERAIDLYVASGLGRRRRRPAL